ncbi:hypothetical protein Dimus_004706 [Dionaea muscipula]
MAHPVSILHTPVVALVNYVTDTPGKIPGTVYYWLAKVVRDSKVKPMLNFEIG